MNICALAHYWTKSIDFSEYEADLALKHGTRHQCGESVNFGYKEFRELVTEEQTMGTQDRRTSMGLNEAYQYWRSIEGGETPSLFKTSGALRTIELAIEPAQSEWQSTSLAVSLQAWSIIRDNLINVLISNFPGYFLVYAESETYPRDSGSDWPLRGQIEFYPDAFKRRNDCFQIPFDQIHASSLTIIRCRFANGEQTLAPHMFESVSMIPEEDKEDEVAELFARSYEICEREAEKGRKRAQRTWYHTQCEARACKNKEERRELLRRLNYLETVWGCGATS